MNEDRPVNGALPDGEEPERKVSFLKLEQLLLGEIQGKEAEELRKLLVASPELSGYMESGDREVPRRTLSDLRNRWEAETRMPETSGKLPPFSMKHGDGQATRSFWQHTAWAMAAMFILGIGIWTWRVESTGPIAGRQQAKGDSHPEATVMLKGREARSGDTLAARAGDTLAFRYRSITQTSAQLWYREDNGEPTPFPGVPETSLEWPPSTRWSSAPGRLLLEGEWKRQTVWIVLSARPIDRREARQSITTNPSHAEGISVFEFHFKHPD